jgi:3-dehydroshikimate dehydratase
MRYVYLLLATLWIPCLALAAQTNSPGSLETLRVDKYVDDGSEGTLRWAIERSNQDAGRYRIEIQGIGQAPYVIRLSSPLPPIQGPVSIEGSAWRRTGEYIAIDGADYIKGDGTLACPGANKGEFGTNVRTTTKPGLVLQDTHSVDISGLDIRNFCIGILINRASNNLIHDNRITANKGGAGIMLTGDDGQGNATATTTINNKVLRNLLVDNGDGLELTRGAAYNLIADNIFRSTAANPEPSQGIEILRGHDNAIVRNRFENYSDGLQINWGNRNYLAANEFTNNAIGINLTGEHNIVDGNVIRGSRIGIALRPEAERTCNRLTANRIWDSNHTILRCEAGGSCIPEQRTGAIVFGVPGLEHAAFIGSRGKGVDPDPSKRLKICDPKVTAADCQPVPNHGQQPPVLSSIEDRNGKSHLLGTIQGTANSYYRLEVFGNQNASVAEAELYLGDMSVLTDKKGSARFEFLLESSSARSFTATATSAEGATSELSAAVSVR